MQPDNEDEAWRAIVENYGERADLDPSDAAVAAPHDDRAELDPEAGPAAGSGAEPGAEVGGATEAAWDAERFVPPPPPPLPQVAPDRLAAWAGVFGAPALLLGALVLGVRPGAWIGYLLVAWFVGGFLYLVLKMPAGPRDPGDDGARL